MAASSALAERAGPRPPGGLSVRAVGKWAAWAYVGLSVAYAAALVPALIAGGGIPADPYWAMAEVVTIVGAPVLVTLIAAIHASVMGASRLFATLSLGWAFAWAALTITVHFVELTVGRQTVAADAAWLTIFGFEWPSLTLAIELTAWHLLLGLALICASAATTGFLGSRPRSALAAAGLLCVVGLIGPVVDDLAWRMIGTLGYGVLLPIACFSLAAAFRRLPQVGSPAASGSHPG